MSGRDVSSALKNPSDKRRLTVESYPRVELSDGFAFERVSAAFFLSCFFLLSFSPFSPYSHGTFLRESRVTTSGKNIFLSEMSYRSCLLLRTYTHTHVRALGN